MSADILSMGSEAGAKSQTPGGEDKLSAKLIEHVDVRLETYLGATAMAISTLKGLTTGSVVALDAALNEVVELRLNGVTIAHGELVAVGDKFGVRIVSIAS
jgi:flagellar motor switch protein FliN/FliY